MSTELDEFLDPIARANRHLEREHYLDNLFHPIYDLPPPEPRWLVQGWIPEGYLVFLASPPKTGKTCLATQLALSIATGTPFAGIPTNQASVLWLAQEESPAERRLILRDHPLAQPSTPLYTCYEPLPIDQEDTLDALNRWIMDTDAKLIVVDPLHGATSGRSLQDGWNARKTLKGLKRLCTQTGVTALVLHHSKQPTRTNPTPRVAESDQLAATASMQIILTSKPLNSGHLSAFRQDTPATVDPQAGTSPKGENFEESRVPCPGISKGEGAPGDRPTIKSPKQAQGGDIFESSSISGPPTPSPHPLTPRLITLRSSGRGDFANRTLHIVSLNLTDYQLTDGPGEPVEVKPNHLETQVLTLLKQKRHTSDELCEALSRNPNTLRNAMTRLRAKGLVTVVRRTAGVNVYGLAKKRSGKRETVASKEPDTNPKTEH